MLNDDKTQFLVIGTSKKLSKVSVSSIRVGDVDVIPVYSAKIWAPGSTRTWMWQRILLRLVVVHSFICIISDTYENTSLVNVLRN